MTQQIEVIQNGATQVINALQSAIVVAMTAAAEGVEGQVKLAQAFQKLEAKEAILEWLVQRRTDQVTKLESSALCEAHKALIRRKVASIDEELTALLTSTGIDQEVSKQSVFAFSRPVSLPIKATNGRSSPPRIRNGRN